MNNNIIVLIIFTLVTLLGCSHSNVGQSNIIETDSNVQQEAIESKTLSFGRKKLVLNDSVYQQIEQIVLADDFLSIEKRANNHVLKTGKVEWGINVTDQSIILFSSTQPEDAEMQKVIDYLTNIYGEPYHDEDDIYNIKWSSSPDTLNISVSNSTLVHLRRVHSEEGGTFLFFQ